MPSLEVPLSAPPPVPVTDTLPPLDVIVAPPFTTKTPKLALVAPVPVRLPPWPTTVTVPLPPAVN